MRTKLWAKGSWLVAGFASASIVCASAQVIAPAQVEGSADRAALASKMDELLSERVGDYSLREAAAPESVKQRLIALRTRLAEQKAQFSVGYTTAFDIPLSMLAGTKIPDLSAEVIGLVNARGAELEKIDYQSALEAKVSLQNKSDQKASLFYLLGFFCDGCL
jgi:hypothetical protein